MAATAADDYGWLGGKQRSTDPLAGLTLMGARLYNSATGRFLSVDPVPGGTPHTYTYPLDPINGYDLNGKWGIPKFLKKKKFWTGALAVGAIATCGVVTAGACLAVGASAAVASAYISNRKSGTLGLRSKSGFLKDAAIGVAAAGVGYGAGKLLDKGMTAYETDVRGKILKSKFNLELGVATHKAPDCVRYRNHSCAAPR